MSIQYLVLGFELRTFGSWVSSFNHWTRAPALHQCWRPRDEIETFPRFLSFFLTKITILFDFPVAPLAALKCKSWEFLTFSDWQTLHNFKTDFRLESVLSNWEVWYLNFPPKRWMHQSTKQMYAFRDCSLTRCCNRKWPNISQRFPQNGWSNFFKKSLFSKQW